MLLESLQIPMVVLGLVILTLLMTVVLKKYQAHQVIKRVTLQGLENNVIDLGKAMDAVKRMPLPREVRVLLRSEILARYQAMASLYSGYPNIDQLIDQAKSKLNAEGPDAGTEPPAMESAAELAKVSNALNTLIRLISSGILTRLTPQDIHKISQDIGEIRAKCSFRFHVDEARRLDAGGQRDKARSLIYKLMSILSYQGPNTDLIRDYYKQGEGLISEYSRIKTPPDQQVAS